MNYVCAAAASTYNTHNIPEELRHDLNETLSVEPRDFGIRVREIVYGSGRYRWPLQPDRFVLADEFTESLARFYAAISEKAFPACALVSVDKALVSRNVIYCHNSGSERRILYETARANDRSAIEMSPDAELALPNKEDFGDPNWNYFYLGSAGSSNYGHWLIDDLPRIKAASSLILDKRPLRILIPGYGSAIDQVRMESIRLILGPVHIDLVDPHRPFYFERVYYATPVSDHPITKSPLALDFAARQTLSSLYAEEKVRDDGQTRNVYVARSRDRGRNLINEYALLPYLTEMGFVVVDTDTMSFEQQVLAFAQASVVIGTMGAAMANTLFCRPHTQVLYLAPRGWIEPFYLDLAVARGHQYRVLYGDPSNPDILPHISDFTISIDALVSAIR